MNQIKIILLYLFTTTLAFSQEKVSLDAVENYIGKEITVCEVVKSTFKTQAHEVSFLNFGGGYPNQKLAIVIEKRHLKNFSYSPTEALSGKTICVTGIVTYYKGKPQIMVKKEKQIVVVGVE
ncbi:MAG TPA: hypothetical protein PLP39_00695 [Flavobacterium lutivivi]|nr:hypothetical protein [Flavobacterium lutivivi]